MGYVTTIIKTPDEVFLVVMDTFTANYQFVKPLSVSPDLFLLKMGVL